MSSSATIHPRIMDRLEKTLLDRLRKFEGERGRTRRIIEGILERIIRLEASCGLALAECRDECDEALREIDALDVYANDGAEVERLLRRIRRIATLLNNLDVRRLTA